MRLNSGNFLNWLIKYIIANTQTIPLFPEIFGLDKKKHHLVAMENLSFTHAYHYFAYEFLSCFYQLNGFDGLGNDLLKDLVLTRIIEPASKLRSVELIEEYFGRRYTRNIIYKGLPEIKLIKRDIENIAVNYAKNNLDFDFSLVFYDVTTLYFESFTNDDFRKCGFSKDNRPGQPQILVALVVNKDGYPVTVDLFEGNKFEGHTLLPVVLNLKNTYKIDKLTIVADAAMLSFDNLKELREYGLSYIVAARLSNLPLGLLRQISTYLAKKEGRYFKTETEYGFLICDYSEKRAAKDKNDRKKQVLKAQLEIDNPKKASKRSRFIKEITKSVYVLNQKLIEKDEMIDGIKGYYTNLDGVRDDLIVERYKDLWTIEKSFRMTKSDLKARPVFHRKKESIEVHILIVFVSLCVSKSIELLTGLSIRKVKDMIWKILDIELIDNLTQQKFIKRMDTASNKMAMLLETIKKSKRVLKG